MARTRDIVAKLWQLCSILRESGISYPEYVTELTYLIFLKMAQETGSEAELPSGYRWHDLTRKSEGPDQFSFYKRLLSHLGTETKGRVKEIFLGAETSLSQPRHLGLLVSEFDSLAWYAAREEGALADLYEGLLEKNSSESKTGAGQYFTQRPLVECMVAVTQPQLGEVIHDPACGTAGFLIAANRYIRSHIPSSRKLLPSEIRFQRNKAFVGVELVEQTHRLALMNAMLHGIYGPIYHGDALGETGASVGKPDVILTNPPFGTKPGGGLPTRLLPIPTSNKQLAFLQHIYLCLKPGGRAAVVMPDMQGPIARKVCADLMEKCNLHTLLRLPTGIFYAQEIKTNVLFFTRSKRRAGNTKRVWVYDLRNNMPTFRKRTPLTRKHFAEFERAFGPDPFGESTRVDQGETGRFRCFSRESVRAGRDTLDITWLHEGNSSHEAQTSPDSLTRSIEAALRAALRELGALAR